MSYGLASQNRHHAYPWMEGAPKPGELEYLGRTFYQYVDNEGKTRTRSAIQNCDARPDGRVKFPDIVPSQSVQQKQRRYGNEPQRIRR